jgi:hypothetical protein
VASANARRAGQPSAADTEDWARARYCNDMDNEQANWTLSLRVPEQPARRSRQRTRYNRREPSAGPAIARLTLTA